MRENIAAAMKQALKDKDQAALGTMRLIMAALKDRDIAARGNGNPDGISGDDILGLLQTMIKQRTESAKMYNDGGRPELGAAEEAEITIIKGFLPAQLSDDEMKSAIAAAIEQYHGRSREIFRMSCLLLGLTLPPLPFLPFCFDFFKR